MDRVQAFTELAGITKEISDTTERLQSLMQREKELYDFLKLPHPGSPVKRVREVVPDPTKVEARRVITSVLKDMVLNHNMLWVNIGILVPRVEQEMPNVDPAIIKSQVRWLADQKHSPVTHNQRRGHISCYTYDKSVKIS